jgi:hypothetical protein
MKKATVEEIQQEIESTRGNVAAIARKLGVNRSTIWKRCNESPTLMAALIDARESMLDNAESMLYKKVLEGSTPELLFFLKTQGRNRGYVERQEVTGANGERMEIVVRRGNNNRLNRPASGTEESIAAGETVQRLINGPSLGQDDTRD